MNIDLNATDLIMGGFGGFVILGMFVYLLTRLADAGDGTAKVLSAFGKYLPEWASASFIGYNWYQLANSGANGAAVGLILIAGIFIYVVLKLFWRRFL